MAINRHKLQIVFLFFVFSTALISGCASVPKNPPITSYTGIPSGTTGIYHIVNQGETLYRIAKTYNVDVSQLMRLNRINSPSQLEIGQRVFIPRPEMAIMPVPALGGLSMNQIEGIVGPRYIASDWRTITLHHSATLQGCARLFDRDHHRRKMGGLFYHFVIGNGTKTPDGDLEVGWRWKRQEKANRPNDIQICLVGNFDRQQVSEAQLTTLVNLVQVLRQQYSISISNIRRHKDIKGRHTDCPGKQFPFKRLLEIISSNR